MTIDLDDLERKARAATPGPWTTTDYGTVITLSSPPLRISMGIQGEREEPIEADIANMAHIAAASPDVVLALVQRVKEAEAALREALGEWEQWVEQEHRGTSMYARDMARIAELRKLLR